MPPGASSGEAFLSGTAAVLAPVGRMGFGDEEILVGDGQPGPNTLKLRQALTDLQLGNIPDPYGWSTPVEG